MFSWVYAELGYNASPVTTVNPTLGIDSLVEAGDKWQLLLCYMCCCLKDLIALEDPAVTIPPGNVATTPVPRARFADLLQVTLSTWYTQT